MNPLHAQMDDTAEHALRSRQPAEACTEVGAHAKPPAARRSARRGLTLWQRLRRWWHVGQLRAELAALEADREALLLDLSDDAALKVAHPERWHDDTVQALHLSSLHELAGVRERIKAKQLAIRAAQGQP